MAGAGRTAAGEGTAVRPALASFSGSSSLGTCTCNWTGSSSHTGRRSTARAAAGRSASWRLTSYRWSLLPVESPRTGHLLLLRACSRCFGQIRDTGRIRSPDPPHRPHRRHAVEVDPRPRPLPRRLHAGHGPYGHHRDQASSTARISATASSADTTCPFSAGRCLSRYTHRRAYRSCAPHRSTRSRWR